MTSLCEVTVQSAYSFASLQHSVSAEAVLTRVYQYAASQRAGRVKVVLRGAYESAAAKYSVTSQAVLRRSYNAAAQQCLDAREQACGHLDTNHLHNVEESRARAVAEIAVRSLTSTVAQRFQEGAAGVAHRHVQEWIQKAELRVAQQQKEEARQVAEVFVQSVIAVGQLQAASRYLWESDCNERLEVPMPEVVPAWVGIPQASPDPEPCNAVYDAEATQVQPVQLEGELLDSQIWEEVGSPYSSTFSRNFGGVEDLIMEGSRPPSQLSAHPWWEVHEPEKPAAHPSPSRRSPRSFQITPSKWQFVSTRPEGMERADILLSLYGPAADAKLMQKSPGSTRSPATSSATKKGQRAADGRGSVRGRDFGGAPSPSTSPRRIATPQETRDLNALRQLDQQRLRTRFQENLKKTRELESEKAHTKKLVGEFYHLLNAAEVESDCRQREQEWQQRAEARRKAAMQRKEEMQKNEEKMKSHKKRALPATPPGQHRASSSSSSARSHPARPSVRSQLPPLRDEASTPEGFNRLDLFFEAYQEGVRRVVMPSSASTAEGEPSSTPCPPRSSLESRASKSTSCSGRRQQAPPDFSSAPKVPWLRPKHVSIEAVVASIVSGKPLPSSSPGGSKWVHLGPAVEACNASLQGNGEVRSAIAGADRS
mmetsp:Transcript_32045/g.73175  ORF Transcript_32045/g.73175 Transcript_32045/m.73175 type:complete len:653 (+) Transcript_32045:89-2047(+)